jgi:2-polyprenyl-3-methyl-5-hydroxy-6-metoxy-1,4-benzoquinol methylase
MQSTSAYNEAKKFTYEFKESRLKKCLKIIESLPAGDMLDIGCSTGDWAGYWSDKGWRCSGIDIDREHIQMSRDRGIDAKYCDLNKESIPFEDQSFDLIFAGEVIEHLIDTDSFLSELHRCLRPGGHALITTPNLVSFENRVRILFGIYPIWVNYNLSGPGHVRAYSPRVLKKQLKEHGFEVVLHKGNWVPFIPQHFLTDLQMPALAITGDLLPGLSMDTIMFARRQ